MIVPGITVSEAERYFTAKLDGGEPELDSHEIGFGDREEWTAMASGLTQWLEENATHFLERNDTQARYEFDSLAAEGIHRVLRLPGFVTASREFWRYVNVTALWEWVVWRHGNLGQDGSTTVAKANYGCGSPRDDLGSRLWFRGELGYDADRADPYELVRRGGTDFWTSGLTRIVYPSARNIARALVELRHPENGVFQGVQYLPQTLDTNAARELYKRLRHYDAILAFACFDRDEARAFVGAISADLRD